jgi:hypothetical protein
MRANRVNETAAAIADVSPATLPGGRSNAQYPV